MKRLFLTISTIAVFVAISTGQAWSAVHRHSVRGTRQVMAVSGYNHGGQHYYGGGTYGSYYGGYPHYYSGPSVSFGIGGVYGYPGYYGYGYPYGYSYGYPYGYRYGYGIPGYTTRTYTVNSSRYGDLAYNDSLVIAVQKRLARAGYYHGPIDAVAGPQTRAAIARWETDHGMSADGRIDQETLQAMGIG